MNTKKKKNLLILGRGGLSTCLLYNHLKEDYDLQVIIEKRPSKLKFYKNRIKKFGLVTVIGQILFSLYSNFLLKKISKKRIKEILNEYKLDSSVIPFDKIVRVNSVNSHETRKLLKEKNADLILVSGTRIISKITLESTDAKFINIHAGITPKYRGVHGGYWSLINNDTNLFGVTVHFVDKGVDTGEVLAHSTIMPTSIDNFTTYPILQLAEGLKVLENILNNIFYNQPLLYRKLKKLPSQQFYHPTLWSYLHSWIKKGIK